MQPYTDFDLERQRLERQRRVAEAMLAQSQTPMGDTQMVSGLAVQRSPLEGLAQIAKAMSGRAQLDDLDRQTKELGDRQRADIASAIEEYTRKTTPRAATSESIVDEQANDGMGANATINAPAFAPTQQDRQQAAMQLMGRVGDPKDAAKLMVADALKKPEIKAYKPGDVLYQEGNKVGEIPAKPQQHVINGKVYEVAPGGGMREVGGPGSEPTQIERELLAAGYTRGSPEWNTAMQMRIKKQTTHQPATNVSVNTEKSFLTNVGEQLGKDVANAAQTARGAVGTINTVNQIRDALDSGKVIAGPGTSARVLFSQIGTVLGAGGDDNEKLTKTRSVIQSLAQLELDAAQQMKGQGQITEAEREIIRRAASGQIDNMTVPELRTLTNSLEKTARFKLSLNAANVERLKRNPNAASMVEFLNVDAPAPYSPRKNGSALPDGWKVERLP